jgi:uncharacterized protein YceK
MNLSRRLVLALGTVLLGGCGAIGGHHGAAGHGGHDGNEAAGETWLGYNAPQWLMHRHGQRDGPPAEAVGTALASIAAARVAK